MQVLLFTIEIIGNRFMVDNKNDTHNCYNINNGSSVLSILNAKSEPNSCQSV